MVEQRQYIYIYNCKKKRKKIYLWDELCYPSIYLYFSKEYFSKRVVGKCRFFLQVGLLKDNVYWVRKKSSSILVFWNVDRWKKTSQAISLCILLLFIIVFICISFILWSGYQMFCFIFFSRSFLQLHLHVLQDLMFKNIVQIIYFQQIKYFQFKNQQIHVVFVENGFVEKLYNDHIIID